METIRFVSEHLRTQFTVCQDALNQAVRLARDGKTDRTIYGASPSLRFELIALPFDFLERFSFIHPLIHPSMRSEIPCDLKLILMLKNRSVPVYINVSQVGSVPLSNAARWRLLRGSQSIH